jgi:hypothetical protein
MRIGTDGDQTLLIAQIEIGISRDCRKPHRGLSSCWSMAVPIFSIDRAFGAASYVA